MHSRVFSAIAIGFVTGCVDAFYRDFTFTCPLPENILIASNQTNVGVGYV
ncbi:MAG: hypothetical protein P1U34_04950 [Coxiellaceae bacterium]|nr:hypothetical protein [Coxiellaceae bacterium]